MKSVALIMEKKNPISHNKPLTRSPKVIKHFQTFHPVLQTNSLVVFNHFLELGFRELK